MDDKDLFDDEIIDLEDEDSNDIVEETVDDTIDETTHTSNVSPKTPNITKRGSKDNISNVLNKNRLANSDKTTPQKLQGINRNNRSFPPLGGSSFSNNNEEDGLKEKVQDKVGGKALTALTGGAVHGKTAEEVAKLARKSGALEMANPLKKYKWFIIGLTASALLLIIAFLVIIAASDDTDMNAKASKPYLNNAIDDEELSQQLVFYGYCNNTSSCKKSGVYKYFEELKELHDKYAEECAVADINNVCGLDINTSLIIETMNYYSNELRPYDSKSTGTTEEDLTKEENQGILAKIFGFFKSQKRIDTMLDDAEQLAKAQAEYVEETCKMSENDKEVTLKYYQVSFDKYISYLAYGESSTHPNYQGEAVKVENDICVGPTDQFIPTEYETQKNGYTTDGQGNVTQISGSGKGVDIVNYALQFVGNPYVWGGTSLTSGTDCSGFTQGVYGHFGISLPRHSADQINASGGTIIGRSLNDLNKAQPGDLLVWDGHVGIYMGGNNMVHAQSTRTGIVTSKVSSSHPFLGIVRF